MNKYKFVFGVFAAGLSLNASAISLGEYEGTELKLGGYFKAEGVFNNPDGGDSNFDGSAAQSRINLSVIKDVNGHKVTGFIEGDFYGGDVTDSSHEFRMRHAYIKVDNLTMGQTWSGQFLATVPYDVPFLDFFNAGKGNVGGNGGVVRPDLVVHYAAHGFRLSLQEPINSQAAYPDFVINYAKRFDNGLALSFALAGRDVAKNSLSSDDSDSEFGGAALYAAKYSFNNTSFHVNGYTGEGQGIYSGFGYGGSWSPVNPVVDVDVNGELIKTTGLVVGLSHGFTSQLRGSARFAQIKADDTSVGTEDKLEIMQIGRAHV